MFVDSDYFGNKSVSFFLLLIAVVITSVLFAFIKRTWNTLEPDLENLCRSYRFRPFLSGLLLDSRSSKSDSSNPKTKLEVTSSERLDHLLDEIITILLADFVDPWYKKLTKNRKFQSSLKRVALRTLKNLADRLRRVDWIVLLTRDVIDDVASHIRLHRMAKEKLAEQERTFKTLRKKPDDLESIFFDFEFKMDQYCRDLISTSAAYESAFLHDLTDVLLYLLLPGEDFRCRPLRFLIREILISKLCLPVLNMLADPDYLNRLVIWLLSNTRVHSDDFVSVLQTCDSVQDLEAMLESVQDEISVLCAKSGNKRAEVESLENITRLIKRRMQRLTSKETPDCRSTFYTDQDGSEKFVHLPLTVVLTNNVAVARFSKFLTDSGRHSYLDCYLAIEGFHSSVEHQLRLATASKTVDPDVHDTITNAAAFVYHQYLSLNAVTKVPIEEELVNRFLARMRADAPYDSWFDQIQARIVELLASDRNLYPAFRKSESYKQMLEELGVLSEVGDPIDGNSISAGKSGARLSIEVGMLGLGQRQRAGAEVFAVYNVRVKKISDKNEVLASWNVIRRYSDFYQLNSSLFHKYPNLHRRVLFPAKKTFNNLKQTFLDRRSNELQKYMNAITQPSILNSNVGLEDEILTFLSQKNVIGASAPLPRKIVTAMFDPIRMGLKAIGTTVTQMPDQVSRMGSGINKAASTVIRSATNSRPPGHDPQRVAANVNLEDEESIPLHMLILLVDELFGLQSRNQWFRSRVISTLRQFLQVTYGQSLNRKILSIAQWLTSEDQLAQFLVSIRNGLKSKLYSKPTTARHPSSAPKTKLLARMLMLSSVPGQLRFAFGSTATNSAVLNLSDLLQHPTLNRRLFYVFAERLLVSVFPTNNFRELFTVLHSKSPRAQR